MTLQSLEVDCSMIDFPGQLCVAISRAKTSAGLYLKDFNSRNIIPPLPHNKEMYNKQCGPCQPDLECCQGHFEDQHNIPTIEEDDDLEAAMASMNIKELVNAVDDVAMQTEASLDSIVKDVELLNLPQSFSAKLELEKIMFNVVMLETHQRQNTIITDIISNRMDDVENICQLLFSIFYKYHCEIVKKLPCGSGSYNDKVIEFTFSSKYDKTMALLFDQVTDDCEQIMWALTMQVSAFVEHVRVLAMEAGEEDVLNPRHSDTLSEEQRAKFRYIAGYCVRKILQSSVRKMTPAKVTKEKLDICRHNERKGILLNSLTRSAVTIVQVSQDEESLKEVFRKQQPGGNLTHVSDEVNTFFMLLGVDIIKQMSPSTLGKYGCSAAEVVSKNVKSNVELLNVWFQLFDSCDLEKYRDIIHELYEEVTQKFTNVLTRQWVKDVNNKQGGKKRAHRVDVLISGKKQKLSEDCEPTVHEKLQKCSDNQFKKLVKSDLVCVCSSVGANRNGNKDVLVKNIRFALQQNGEVREEDLQALSEKAKKLFRL